MDVKPANEVDKLTSNLQVYEGLVKDQAAEIAALKAEVAFLKKQVRNRENSSHQEGKPQTELEVPDEDSKPRPATIRDTPISTASGSVAGGSVDDPLIIDDDNENDGAPDHGADGPLTEQSSEAMINPILYRRKPAFHSLSKSPILRRLPEHNSFSKISRKGKQRFRALNDSPRKKPKLDPEIGAPAAPPSPPHSEHFDPPFLPPTPASEDPEHDPEPFRMQEADLQEDASDASSLTSLSDTEPPTPSRSASPAGDHDHDHDANLEQRRATYQRRSTSELSYLDEPATQSEVDENGAGPSRVSRTHQSSSSRRVGHPAHPRPATSRSRASPAPRVDRRLTDAQPYTLALANRSILKLRVNRTEMSALFKGHSQSMCVRTAGRDFLYPKVDMNPFLPRQAGAPGLIYRAKHGGAWHWKGEEQTLFVGLKDGVFKYCGQYRIVPAEPLGREDFRTLTTRVKKLWAATVGKGSRYKDIRVRIVTRRDHGREATAEEIARVVSDRSNHSKGLLETEEILSAYEQGQERLLVWRMDCIGFDQDFLRDVKHKLSDRSS